MRAYSTKRCCGNRDSSRVAFGLSGRARLNARCQASSTSTPTAALVFPKGETGAWDSGAVSNPVVRVYQGDDEERWFMWYTGRKEPSVVTDAVFPAASTIGVAVSSDGLTWTRGEGPVQGSRTASDVGFCLEASAASGDWWTLDTHSVAVGDVQMFSSGTVNGGTGVYWMFYTGVDFTPLQVPDGLPGVAKGADVEGLCGRPGLAMSQDGRNWARIEAEHHTHALFDKGEEGEWDSLFVAGPQVLAAGPKDMRLFYHSFDAAADRYSVGLATSEDGFKWEKQGKAFSGGTAGEFDSKGAASHCVVRDLDSRQFYMFYEALDGNGQRSIGVAVSEDGMHDWRRHPEPVLKASSDSEAWDSGEVGAPCAVSMAAGKWRLYYAGKRAGESAWNGIGVALSGDSTVLTAPTNFVRRKL